MVASKIDFEPLADYVLLEEIKVTETPSGIHLPDSVEATGPGKARVVKVGPGRYDDRGQLLPMPVQPGDVVYAILAMGSGRIQPMKVNIDRREYVVLSAGSLIGKTSD